MKRLLRAALVGTATAALLALPKFGGVAALLIDNQWRSQGSAPRLIVVGQARDCADGIRTARRALRRRGIVPPSDVVFASLDSIPAPPDGAKALLLKPWRRKTVAWYLRLHEIKKTPAMLYFAAGARRPIFLSSPQFNTTVRPTARPVQPNSRSRAVDVISRTTGCVILRSTEIA